MNLLSHWTLAGQLAKNSPITLHFAEKTSFRLGNLWPDLSASFMRYPHTPAVMYDKVEEIIASQFQRIREGLRPSPFQMGIVTHYLADFFCSAHNQPFGENMQSHYLYEKNLYHYIQTCLIPQFDDLYSNDAELCQNLRILHQKFTDDLSGYECDTAYIVRACCLFYYSIGQLAEQESAYRHAVAALSDGFRNV